MRWWKPFYCSHNPLTNINSNQSFFKARHPPLGTSNTTLFFPHRLSYHTRPGHARSLQPTTHPNKMAAGVTGLHPSLAIPQLPLRMRRSGPGAGAGPAQAQRPSRSAPAGAPCRSAPAQQRPTSAPSPCAISEYAASCTYNRTIHTSCLSRILPPPPKAALMA